jgi:hypothetical protein
MAARRPSRRSVALQIIAMTVAAIMGIFILVRTPVLDETDALAAPPAPRANASALAPAASSAPPAPAAAAAAPAPAADAGATADASTDDPIDLAIAPDGGVPFHPSGTTYRSPFAKPNAGAPVRIRVGMLLNSIDDYDVKSGRYAADFFVSLTSDTPMPNVRLAFPNGKVDDKEVIADKPTFKLYRLIGNFKSPPNLRKYPFDAQDLKIYIEDDFRGVDQVRFVVDKERTQIARNFRILGWKVAYLEARAISQAYPDRFQGDDLQYGRYVFDLRVERYATSAAFKVFVPAFVIVIIALLGMWVPPNEMEVRSNAGAPMLAAAVLFHFALMQELPATSYLTRADKLMLGVYVSLALGMVSTWWMFLVKEQHMEDVFRIARTVVPVLTVAVMALACLL